MSPPLPRRRRSSAPPPRPRQSLGEERLRSSCVCTEPPKAGPRARRECHHRDPLAHRRALRPQTRSSGTDAPRRVRTPAKDREVADGRR